MALALDNEAYRARVIHYRPDLDIRNIHSLPAGSGCRWLVVIESIDDGAYIAKRWARTRPVLGRGEFVVRFCPLPEMDD